MPLHLYRNERHERIHRPLGEQTTTTSFYATHLPDMDSIHYGTELGVEPMMMMMGRFGNDFGEEGRANKCGAPLLAVVDRAIII